MICYEYVVLTNDWMNDESEWMNRDLAEIVDDGINVIYNYLMSFTTNNNGNTRMWGMMDRPHSAVTKEDTTTYQQVVGNIVSS